MHVIRRRHGLRHHGRIGNEGGLGVDAGIPRLNENALSLQHGALLNSSARRLGTLERHKRVATISTVAHLDAVSAVLNGSEDRERLFDVRRLDAEWKTRNEDAVAHLRLWRPGISSH